MRVARSLLAGVWLACLGVFPPGCAHVHRPSPPSDPAVEACLNAGCDRPLDHLLGLLGPCDDLKSAVPGRKITLMECLAAALVNGRVGDDSIRVKTHDAAQALAQTAGKDRDAKLAARRIYLGLEAGTQDLLLAVESAYWNLALARGGLRSRDEALRDLDEEAANVKARFEEKLLTRQDVEAMEEQRHLARAEQVAAVGKVAEAERVLRLTAGLPSADGTALLPCDPPCLTMPPCDPLGDLEAARTYLPELALARLDVEIACRALARARDKEKERPAAMLKVQRDEAALRDAEERMLFDLQKSQTRQVVAWETLKATTDREDAARRRLDAVAEKWKDKEFGELRELLLARSGFAAAQRDNLHAAVEYQVAQAEHRRRKGVLLQHHRVCIERAVPPVAPGD